MTRILSCLCLILTTVVITTIAQKPAQSNPPAQPAPVQTVVPYNGAVYNGPGITPEQGKKLITLLESIDDRLARLNERLDTQAAEAPKVTWQQVVTKHCASCHNETSLKGDFIIVGEDGKTPKPLSAREWAKVTEAVTTEHMPPKERPKLKPEEKAAFKKK